MKRIILTLLFSAASVLLIRGQEFAGISVALMKGGICGDYLLVTGVLENGPADKAGLLLGTCIYEVDGTDLKDLSLDEAVALIRGPVGTDVILTISEDRRKKLHITRQSVNQTAVEQQAQGLNGWVPVALHKTRACGDFYAIKDVLSGSSADLTGLVAGNCIYAINGRAVDQLSAHVVRNVLNGEAGTGVELTLSQDGLSKKVVTRQEYNEEDAERFREQLKETRIAFGNKLTEEYMERAREERSGQIMQEYREALDAVFAGIDLLMKSNLFRFGISKMYGKPAISRVALFPT